MSDNADGKSHEQGAAGLARASQANIQPPAKPEIKDQNDGTGSKRERFTEKLEGFSPVFEFAVAAAAVIGVALVIVQIYYLGKSDRMSREALRVTRENSASSDKTSAQILEKMEESNRITREAMEQSKRQSEAALIASRDQATRALEESKRQSNSSLAVARKAMQRSEKPWVNIEGVSVTLDPGKPATASILVSNVGRSPANDLHPVCSLILFTKGQPIDDHSQEGLFFAPLGPGQPFKFNFAFPDLVITDAIAADIRSSKTHVTITAEVIFTDAFGVKDAAYSCFQYDGTSYATMVACEQDERARKAAAVLKSGPRPKRP